MSENAQTVRTMQAAVVNTFGGPEQVEIVRVPIPQPGAYQVRSGSRRPG